MDYENSKDILIQLDLADEKAKQNQHDEAIKIYKDLLTKTEDKSTLGTIYNKLGNIYYNTNDFDSAISAYESTLNYFEPTNIYNMLGFLYFYKNSDKSIEYYLKGLEKKPDLKNFVMLTQVMIKNKNYSQKDLKAIFEKYVDIFRPELLNGQAPFEYNPKDFDKNKKLKIGYLSSDFYCHAMMSFILPVIENHNHSEFDITLYSCKDKSDVVTQRLKNTGANIKDCSNKNNFEIADLIHNDKIDILVDLSGYTHNAIWALLYKPAPIIVQFLGFLGTYGMKEVDYILCDKFTIPNPKYYTEKPMYIKHGMNRFTFQTQIMFPEITPLPYETNGYITFGSFNCISKINPYTVSLWSKVLKKVENSKLLIYRTQLEERDIKRYLTQFEQNGIPKDRLIFENQPMSDSHMKSYLKCDIALDPVPFSGLTITIEQAYMGVPTLTMYCDTISSKSASRANLALGLKNFIAKNEKDYVKKAVKRSSDINKLKFYRKNLRTIVQKSPLCNNFKEYAKEIETQYIKAWKKFCR